MITLIITLAVVGFITWVVVTYIPMPQQIKTLIIAVVLVCMLLYLLQVFGILDTYDIPIPRLGHPTNFS